MHVKRQLVVPGRLQKCCRMSADSRWIRFTGCNTFRKTSDELLLEDVWRSTQIPGMQQGQSCMILATYMGRVYEALATLGNWRSCSEYDGTVKGVMFYCQVSQWKEGIWSKRWEGTGVGRIYLRRGQKICWRKKKANSKKQKHEYLKANSPPEVIPRWWPRWAEAEETGGFFSGWQSHTWPILLRLLPD